MKRFQIINVNKLFTICFFMLMSAEIFSQTSINWEIPFTPIKITYSRSNGISISASAGVPTPIGRFSIDYTQSLYKKRENSNIIYVDRVKIQKQDLLVIIRDRNKTSVQDVIYKIENGANLEVTADGTTNIKVSESIVIVDVTNVDNCIVSFLKGKTELPNKAKIQDIIGSYYDNLKNNRYGNLNQMFAYRVKRFYGINDVDKNVVIEKLKNYDKMFGVYDKHFNVRWNTLSISNDKSEQIFIDYLVDYSIDRYDKTKYSKFLLKMYIELDQNYQIVSIYETILNRE